MTSPAGHSRRGPATPQHRPPSGRLEPPAPRTPAPGRHRPNGRPAGSVPAPRTPPRALDETPPTDEIPMVPPPADPPAPERPAPAGGRRRAAGSRRAPTPARARRAQKSGRGRRAVMYVGALLALVVVLVGAKLLFSGAAAPPVAQPVAADPAHAAVGDCVTGGSADDLAVVGCTSPRATDRIVAKVAGTEAAFNADDDLALCRSAPETQSAFYEGTDKGFILCLAPVAPKH